MKTGQEERSEAMVLKDLNELRMVLRMRQH